ncbi:potassium channel [Coniochaeta ligniaria NRRL 30616]|uniref:Potassium channel n=1 Tax=Coniochaeta ligniaria NRRL 30616 TaxID=1408157 RepID=A0A1J7J5Y5_9PEZI|nr:potassium channel [Coniochaeta ligniaria NRRL 30616]
MNDASGENVDAHVEALEGETEKLQQSMDNDNAHLDPSRWFFASSLFPMIAGTLGPVASAFSICALVRPWRQHFPPGSDIQKAEYIPDPEWLLAINGVQLVIAVIANMALLLNMTKRLRFTIAQPITIVGWYFSVVCLIVLQCVASTHLRIDPWEEHVWSQAFYYGIYAAILYFIDASLMAVTFWGAYTDHYDKDFLLTPSQRTLMLQTIMFLMYLLLGALVFSEIEGWNYLDAVYWADVTLFTVGFGDLSAATSLGRALLIPYALVGVISLGLVIGSIRALVLDRGKRRIDARMIEKNRRRVVKRMARKGTDSILQPIAEKESEANADSPAPEDRHLTEFERREKEFKLMRKIQRKAERRRRWVAMATSTGTWVVLWLVGAKIFQVCEEPYQHWSYFDGVYLGFVSLTTIGYGDLTPISNPGKSFFVFWSLMALPTMTILISNAGDTVVKGIRDLTNAIGTVTILPGEQGFRKGLKEVLGQLTMGKLFDEDIKESPPGFLGDAEEHRHSEEGPASSSNGGSGKHNSPRRASTMKSSRGSSSHPKKDHHLEGLGFQRSESFARQDLPNEIPTDRNEYHIMLLEEMARVTRHLKNQPPRKYSWAEWAWYLKLIGEDEANAQTHRKARPHVHGKAGEGEVDASMGQTTQWSWVGSKSPLMGSQEEAEWILEKLTQKLTQELKDERSRGKKAQEEMEGDGKHVIHEETGDDESRKQNMRQETGGDNGS